VPRGERLQAYFFRSHDGLEADLLIQANGAVEVIEIKLTTSPTREDFARLEQVSALVGGTRQVLISRTRKPAVHGNRWSLDLATYLQRAKSR
jgi:hypothetical protein